MIGLGTMGQNLVYNMADRGFTVAGYDKSEAQVKKFNEEAGDKKVKGWSDIQSFVSALQQPRNILLLVPAGKVVDIVVEELRPLLGPEDVIIDCGNSHFTDTERRIKLLEEQGIHFMGVGISGGETGAREGASIMPGGPKNVYDRVAGVLESVAAKIDGEACIGYMGTGSAGHYVKMVHNGIEYALMQLISESYHLLKVIGGLNNEELSAVYADFNDSPLQSYLLEITSAIFLQKDDQTENELVDMILDRAFQKGTGAWTSQDAMNMQVPIPAIDAAVAQREITTIKEERVIAHKILKPLHELIKVEHSGLINLLKDALHFCMINIYAQGMSLLKQADKTYKYGTDLSLVASIWRGGCIIRSKMLEDITRAYKDEPAIDNLLIAKVFNETLLETQKHTRSVITTAVNAGIPVPAMMACLGYYDSYRSEWLPANLVQAQRDFFGAHTYERIDKTGSFHTEWNVKIN